MWAQDYLGESDLKKIKKERVRTKKSADEFLDDSNQSSGGRRRLSAAIGTKTVGTFIIFAYFPLNKFHHKYCMFLTEIGDLSTSS